MKEKPDYLLKYVNNGTYLKVLNSNADYILESLVDNRVDVDLNIRYLLKLGVKNIDVVVLERVDDLLLDNGRFMKKMDKYIDNLTLDGLINMLENS